MKKLFNNLSSLMREHNLVGIGLTLHTRKRAQGQSDRRFDDLFGSREWKGRLGTMLYMETGKITAWKNRGGRLNRKFKRQPGKKAWALLGRPGLEDDTVPPFTLTVPSSDDDAEAAEEIERQIIEVLRAEPGVHTKSALASTCGKRYKDARAVIATLQEEGRIVPTERRAKLSLAKPAIEVTAPDDPAGVCV